MNTTVVKNAKKMQKQSQKDIWRKRVIAVIGKYLSSMHDERYCSSGASERIERAKAVASHAAGNVEFNKIPRTKLIAIYNQFLVINKTMNRTITTAYECLHQK